MDYFNTSSFFLKKEKSYFIFECLKIDFATPTVPIHQNFLVVVEGHDLYIYR